MGLRMVDGEVSIYCVPENARELVDIGEAASIANMSDQSMRNIIARGEIEVFPVRGCRGAQMRLRDLMAWIDGQQATARRERKISQQAMPSFVNALAEGGGGR